MSPNHGERPFRKLSQTSIKLQSQAHSGSSLEVFQDDRSKRRLVRKLLPEPVSRAKKSVELQASFDTVAGFQAAEIIAYYEIEGGLTIEMPYVEGLVGEHYFTACGYSDLKQIRGLLSNYFAESIARSTMAALPISDLSGKVRSLEATISSAPLEFDQKLINRTIEFCYSSIKIHEGAMVPFGRPHGDLTFGNMIYSKKNKTITLIDFLPAFSQTILLDFAKIRQETVFGWSARHLKGVQSPRVEVVKQFFAPLDNCFSEYANLMPLFDALNLLRICPYTHDVNTRAWLEASLTKVRFNNE